MTYRATTLSANVLGVVGFSGGVSGRRERELRVGQSFSKQKKRERESS